MMKKKVEWLGDVNPVIRLGLLMFAQEWPNDGAKLASEKWKELRDAAKKDDKAEVPQDIVRAMSDGMNTPRVLMLMSEYARTGRRHELWASLVFLGLVDEVAV